LNTEVRAGRALGWLLLGCRPVPPQNQAPLSARWWRGRAQGCLRTEVSLREAAGAAWLSSLLLLLRPPGRCGLPLASSRARQCVSRERRLPLLGQRRVRYRASRPA
jgi:hypothetical protein